MAVYIPTHSDTKRHDLSILTVRSIYKMTHTTCRATTNNQGGTNLWRRWDHNSCKRSSTFGHLSRGGLGKPHIRNDTHLFSRERTSPMGNIIEAGLGTPKHDNRNLQKKPTMLGAAATPVPSTLILQPSSFNPHPCHACLASTRLNSPVPRCLACCLACASHAPSKHNSPAHRGLLRHLA